MVEQVGNGVGVVERKVELHSCARCSDEGYAGKMVWLGMDAPRKAIRDLKLFWIRCLL